MPKLKVQARVHSLTGRPGRSRRRRYVVVEGRVGVASALPHRRSAPPPRQPRAKPLHAVEPMLDKQRVVEQVVLSVGTSRRSTGAGHAFVPLFRFAIAAAEPHQRHELGLLAGISPWISSTTSSLRSSSSSCRAPRGTSSSMGLDPSSAMSSLPCP